MSKGTSGPLRDGYRESFHVQYAVAVHLLSKYELYLLERMDGDLTLALVAGVRGLSYT